jgi:hypothetical protein
MFSDIVSPAAAHYSWEPNAANAIGLFGAQQPSKGCDMQDGTAAKKVSVE